MLLKETMLYVTTLDMLCLCLHTIKPCTCSTTHHPTCQLNSNPQFLMDNLRLSPRINVLLAKTFSIARANYFLFSFSFNLRPNPLVNALLAKTS